MALASDLKAVGVEQRHARLLGDTFQTIGATGTTRSDATALTSSIVHCDTSSGANAGLKLPAMEASTSKKHTIINETGGNIRVYTESASDSIKLFDGRSGTADYVVVPTMTSVTLTKILENTWSATA